MGCIEMGRFSCSYCFMYSTRIVQSFIFLGLYFLKRPNCGKEVCVLSLSLGRLYLPIYGIGTLIFGFSDPLSSYHAMLYEHNIAWLWAAVAIAIFILSIVIGGLQELQDVFERRRQQRAAEETLGGDNGRYVQKYPRINYHYSKPFGKLPKQDQEQDSDIAKALSTVGQAIHDSGNREAGELFDQFNEELSKDKP
jgi:hypothetical protein